MSPLDGGEMCCRSAAGCRRLARASASGAGAQARSTRCPCPTLLEPPRSGWLSKEARSIAAGSETRCPTEAEVDESGRDLAGTVDRLEEVCATAVHASAPERAWLEDGDRAWMPQRGMTRQSATLGRAGFAHGTRSRSTEGEFYISPDGHAAGRCEERFRA